MICYLYCWVLGIGTTWEVFSGQCGGSQGDMFFNFLDPGWWIVISITIYEGVTYSVGCRFMLFWVVEPTTLEVKKL